MGQIKNRLKKTLETSKILPAVPLKLRPFAATSRSNKRYPLTRADGRTYCAWGSALRLGSDGYLNMYCRLTPCADSLKTHNHTVFVKAFYLFALIIHP